MPLLTLDYEPFLRVGIFAAVFLALAACEMLAPRRRQEPQRQSRWPANLGVAVIDTLLVRLLFPVTAVGMAVLAEARGWGLLNAIAAPRGIAIVVAAVVLDLAIYLQHVVFHAVPALWRLH